MTIATVIIRNLHGCRMWLVSSIFFLLLLYANAQNDPDPPEGRPIRNHRIMYVAAVEEDWDYAPNGGPNVPFANRFLQRSTDPVRIGKVYKKALFREFTDSSYRVRTPRPEWLGILGPVVAGEVGDKITIYFFNNASFPISMHPHGLRYRKRHEGALYEDNTTGRDKDDDRVPPGEHYEYNWFLIEEDAPSETDPDCITWIYHSHRNADTDLHAGLLGVIVVCRPGKLTPSNTEEGLDKDYALLFLAFDENESELLDDNINSVNPSITQEERERLKEDRAFRQSNIMFSINGYAYGNLPGLDMCIGDRVGWHMVGLGNEVDVHSISVEGQVLTMDNHRTDTINLFPAKFTRSYMTPRRLGSWPIRCEVGRHTEAGMYASIFVERCNKRLKPVGPSNRGRVRKYFIAAEEVIWDYGPSGYNQFTQNKLIDDPAASPYFIKNATRIGGKYKKALFVEYTDDSFRTKKKRTREEIHLGHQGPTIKAEVGDTIEIMFLNKARANNYSLHTHGAFYRSPRMRGLANTGVLPGQKRLYTWFIHRDYGPTSLDPDCLTWRYFSGETFVFDFYDGLHGILLTCKPGTLDSRGRQKNVDREFFLLFSVMDETISHYFDENIQMFIGDPSRINRTDARFFESNQMHAINGRVFGNLEGLQMCKGDLVSWHIVGFGKTIDLHVAYFHGHTFSINGMFRDAIAVVPSAHQTVIMKAENPGEWAIDCRTNDHLMNGMRAIYKVRDCNRRNGKPEEFWPVPDRFPKEARVYYIAAIEIEWDYAPFDRHIITGESLLENNESRPFVINGDNRIGRLYKKVVYREFTDSSFREQKRRGPDEEHLAILGPLIAAEVGDTIRVVFKNLASRPYSMHPHGVLYRKPVETKGRAIDRGEVPVNPGDTYIYEWDVPYTSGPGKNGFNCVPWAYYSAVDPVRDTNTGLVGPLITCRKGVLNRSGSRRDMNHQFAVLFTIFDENFSWLLDENIRTYTRRPETVNKNDNGFITSNRKYAINGRIYGTLTGLVAEPNQNTAWYMMGLGTEIDMHTAHFHGQTFFRRINSDNRGDVVDLFPGVFQTVEIETDNPGMWFLHCHVDDHMKFGMNAVFTVNPFTRK
ncbi:hephaestin-like protein [Centruroides vittatus]|uniref:hephaestin-like protein n=1 Tax=Centruroides vittatus TaxID=120091 RepID=UPI00350F67D8